MSKAPHQILSNLLASQLVPLSELSYFAKEAGKKRGEVIHYLLSLVDDIDQFLPALKEKVRAACHRFLYPLRSKSPEVTASPAAGTSNGVYNDAEEIIATLRKILNLPKIRELFSEKNNPAYNEKEVVDKQGNLKRIDRLILKEKEIIVVDYKTGESYSEEHAGQIKEYIDILKEIYPNRSYRGLLIYIDTKEIREIGDEIGDGSR